MSESRDGRSESPEQDGIWLGRLLEQAPAPAATPALTRRVLADFDRIAARPSLARALRRLADAVWPDAPLWQPACAFALALLIGTGVAAFAPFDPGAQGDVAGAFAFDGQPDLAQDF